MRSVKFESVILVYVLTLGLSDSSDRLALHYIVF